MKPQEQRHFDAVIIGSGMGGLGAAVELAMNGAGTLLLEQHNLPGGYATSFVRGRFEFEPSLHELGSAGFVESEKRGLKKYFEDEIGADIAFARVPEAYRLILTEKKIDVNVPFGIDAFIQTVDKQVPGGGRHAERYLSLCGEIIAALEYLAEAGSAADKRKLLQDYGNFLRTSPYTMREVADSLKIPREVLDLLYPYFCYIGVPESRQSFMLFGALLYSYIAYGAVIPRMRSHEIASAMIAKFEEHGGLFEANTKVEKILVRKGRAVGVETSRGETILCDTVVSNAGPPLVYGGLISPETEVPPTALRNLNARILGPAGFVVYLGLNSSARELGLSSYSYFISPHMDTDVIYESMKQFEGPLMQASVCLNAAIPDCSPPGTTILSLTTVYTPGVWDSVTPADYFTLKNRLAGKMISQFEEATGVKLRGHIEEIEVATPQTFSRYTGTYNGSIYGWEPEPWDSIIPRALSEEKERYIDRLYFCGGYGFRTHGFSGALFSGRKTARDIISGLPGKEVTV
ncbi:MAG: NAD(P)/FAD-dependent oxidoreductase [Spirochaetales bacterium]|nr:NAD(P)/FAD-dependent oxidoreductase [Spirochaetales bacterium]